MNEENREVSNQYGLRNSELNNHAGEEEENKEEEVQEEEDNNAGEEGRERQRQRVDEVYNKDSEENLYNDNLEVPQE